MGTRQLLDNGLHSRLHRAAAAAADGRRPPVPRLRAQIPDRRPRRAARSRNGLMAYHPRRRHILSRGLRDGRVCVRDPQVPEAAADSPGGAIRVRGREGGEGGAGEYFGEGGAAEGLVWHAGVRRGGGIQKDPADEHAIRPEPRLVGSDGVFAYIPVELIVLMELDVRMLAFGVANVRATCLRASAQNLRDFKDASTPPPSTTTTPSTVHICQ